ncbi:hypothetical protein M441DRAFT_66801 [Trichoderma asperellum CBS 433.97]|uniref:Uncharacterized protein n=1 Tax=Trichoderma asperellum (strain ATCC 204424 / CBS 433.97 / NBRC 101777) TaxID=1042311 RepID=A0A2T3ZE19_TRIA4|nr:hypothetical protein M441DRAFT_66801 [Trichoderma asperellum CBS 433.97]PTB43043.1 hypothetical protein M441DRAFT_66801 [Trichoderma asperellum CBS 433.97]
MAAARRPSLQLPWLLLAACQPKPLWISRYKVFPVAFGRWPCHRYLGRVSFPPLLL